MANAPRDNNRVPTLLGVSSSGFLTPTTVAVNPTTHAMLVEGSFTPPDLQDVNLTEVGGAAIALGQATMSASLPVVIASDQTAFPISQSGVWTVTANAGTNLNTSALLTTADFNAAFGTAGSADAQVLSIQGIASMTPVQVSQATASNLNATVVQATGSNLHTVVDSGTITTVTTLTGTTSLTPGTGAANLGKAEDAAHSSGDVGVMALTVRNDTVADFSGADNDYIPLSATLKGQLLTVNAPRGRKVSSTTTIASSTSETTVLSAASSTFHDVYGVIVTNTSSTATEVAFKDATGGTTRFTISAPANDTRGFMLPMDAAWNQSSSNNNWTATAADSVASLLISVFAVKNI